MPNTFKVTERTGYSGAWVALATMFLLALVAWWVVTPVLTLIIALLGIIGTSFYWKQGKKILGDQIELTEKGFTIKQGDEYRCVAYAEIDAIKETKQVFVEKYYQIKTRNNNTFTIKPENYENGEEMRKKLNEAFVKYNCEIENK